MDFMGFHGFSKEGNHCENGDSRTQTSMIGKLVYNYVA